MYVFDYTSLWGFYAPLKYGQELVVGSCAACAFLCLVLFWIENPGCRVLGGHDGRGTTRIPRRGLHRIVLIDCMGVLKLFCSVQYCTVA